MQRPNENEASLTNEDITHGDDRNQEPQIKRRLDTSAGALKPPPKRSPRKTKPSSEGVSEGSGSQLALPPAVLPSAAEHVEPTPALEPPPSIPTRKQTAVAEGNPLDDSVADDV